MKSLVLLRHGQSVWNHENRFTGWTDVDLSEQGVAEARAAGRAIKAAGLAFDVAFTSVLRRAIKTLWLTLEELDRMWIPVVNDWRMNERHYGALQGLNKAETEQKYGAPQVKLWRRSYDVRPPALAPDDRRSPRGDPRYATLRPEQVPLTENLADTVERFLPCWHDRIAPALKEGKRVIVAAHGNSLRALKLYLDGLTPQQIVEVEIPTGAPLVYELGDDLKPIRNAYLPRA